MRLQGGALRLLLLVGSIIAVSCGGNDLSPGHASKQGQPADQGSASSAATDFTAGVKLAVINQSPSQSVEFWESEPGTVLMIQMGRGERREVAFAWAVIPPMHEYLMNLDTRPITFVSSHQINLVNTSWLPQAVAPNGMKVSTGTGKLYVWSCTDECAGGERSRIDPFNGLVHTVMNISFYDTNLEAEGLDIISTSDVGYSGTGAEIILQTLENHWPGRDTWSGTHYVPDDASRL